MSKKNHVNGDNPYVMSVAEAREEIDGWTSSGGQVRTDGPHPGKNDEPHIHFYSDNDPSRDILVQIVPTEEELKEFMDACDTPSDEDDTSSDEDE